MYIFRQSLIEILKTFVTSIICSLIFTPMIYRDSALPNNFICFVLNGSALLLFLYINYSNWSRLYKRTYAVLEYYVPVTVATLTYAAVTMFAYSKRFGYYMWLFLPTRFLEPKLNGTYAQLSIFAAYIALVVLIFLTPSISYHRANKSR